MISHNIIKINKCNENYKWINWYKDMIGMEFKVGKPTVFNGFKIYQVSEPFKYIHRIILQKDCEFVKSLRTDNKKGA